MEIVSFANVEGDIESFNSVVSFAADRKARLLVCAGGMINAEEVARSEEYDKMGKIAATVLEAVTLKEPVPLWSLMPALANLDGAPEPLRLLAQQYLSCEAKLEEGVDRDLGAKRRRLDRYAEETGDVSIVPTSVESGLNFWFDQFCRHQRHYRQIEVANVQLAGIGEIAQNGERQDIARGFLTDCAPDVCVTIDYPGVVGSLDYSLLEGRDYSPGRRINPVLQEVLKDTEPDLWIYASSGRRSQTVRCHQNTRRGAFVHGQARLGRIHQSSEGRFTIFTLSDREESDRNIVQNISSYVVKNGDKIVCESSQPQ